MKRNGKDLERVQKTLFQGVCPGIGLVEGTVVVLLAPRNSCRLVPLPHVHQLDKSRWRAIKSAIKEDFKALCTENFPVDGLLCNRNFEYKVKNLGDTNRILNSLSKDTGSPKRFLPFVGRGRQRKGDWSPKWEQNYPAHRIQERFQPSQTKSSRSRRRRQEQRPSSTYKKAQGGKK